MFWLNRRFHKSNKLTVHTQIHNYTITFSINWKIVVQSFMQQKQWRSHRKHFKFFIDAFTHYPHSESACLQQKKSEKQSVIKFLKIFYKRTFKTIPPHFPHHFKIRFYWNISYLSDSMRGKAWKMKRKMKGGKYAYNYSAI